jgi:hypothetical protein
MSSNWGVDGGGIASIYERLNKADKVDFKEVRRHPR